MRNKKDVTIYDIASELKVAPSTVSRALKDHFSIGKDTIKAVKKLADERGYQPNHIAASLRRNKTNTIGISISWIDRPFISSVIAGIEEVARDAGYNVLISQSHDSYENEVANVKTFYASRIAGLVAALSMDTMKYDHFNRFSSDGIPVVFVDRIAEDLDCDKVMIDNFSAGFEATQHLIEQGCRRIAHIAGSRNRNNYRDRQNGYLKALKKHGIAVDPDLIVEGQTMSAEEGWQTAERLLSLPDPPDGVFSSNDTVAVSVIRCAKKRGLRIPQDLAVVGFNNDPISVIVDPPLSTLDHPGKEMGRIAARQVLKYMDREEDGDLEKQARIESVVLDVDLIVRESSLRKK